MVSCPRCGHQNLDGMPTCSQCGSGLPVAGSMPVPGAGAPPATDGVDEYHRLMAKRDAARRRNRSIAFAVVGVIVAAVVVLQIRERGRKAAAQDKLKVFETFAELEKRETGAFWGCVMAADGVDVGMFTKAEQFQQKIESAYFTQQKTFSEHLVTECVPKIERARQAFGSLRDAPSELAGAIAEYQAALPKLQSGLEEYAEKLKNRGTVKDVDQLIQEMGNAWHSTPDPTPEAAAFEKFMYCAVPGLAKMKDAQALLEFLADQCFKQDAVAYMTRVRTECGPLLTNVDKDAKVDLKSVPTWKASRKAFFEEDARQLSAWESCGKRSRKGQKKEDMEAFLFAVNDYMAARTKVAQAARGIAEAAK